MRPRRGERERHQYVRLVRRVAPGVGIERRRVLHHHAAIAGVRQQIGIDGCLDLRPAHHLCRHRHVVDIKGINFVKRSVAYAGETPLPTEVVGRTQIKATISQNILAQAGKLHITIRNPEPLATPEWGSTSNQAHILVPFSFTTAWSHNKY